MHNCVLACVRACFAGRSQGEVFVPLQLLVSAALARLFGLAAQPVRGHLHEGAEAGVTARQLGRLGLG